MMYSRQTPSPQTAKHSLGNILSIVDSNASCAREWYICGNNHILSFFFFFLRQPYQSGSSLTTCRKHLAKEHLPEYLALIETRKWINKLPDTMLKRRQEQRAKDLQHTAFSIQALEEQLITVIVTNDLVSST
jgi:hypothetical protein